MQQEKSLQREACSSQLGKRPKSSEDRAQPKINELKKIFFFLKQCLTSEFCRWQPECQILSPQIHVHLEPQIFIGRLDAEAPIL